MGHSGKVSGGGLAPGSLLLGLMTPASGSAFRAETGAGTLGSGWGDIGEAGVTWSLLGHSLFGVRSRERVVGRAEGNPARSTWLLAGNLSPVGGPGAQWRGSGTPWTRAGTGRGQGANRGGRSQSAGVSVPAPSPRLKTANEPREKSSLQAVNWLCLNQPDEYS